MAQAVRSPLDLARFGCLDFTDSGDCFGEAGGGGRLKNFDEAGVSSGTDTHSAPPVPIGLGHVPRLRHRLHVMPFKSPRNARRHIALRGEMKKSR